MIPFLKLGLQPKFSNEVESALTNLELESKGTYRRFAKHSKRNAKVLHRIKYYWVVFEMQVEADGIKRCRCSLVPWLSWLRILYIVHSISFSGSKARLAIDPSKWLLQHFSQADDAAIIELVSFFFFFFGSL